MHSVFPIRSSSSHKGQNGKVVIVGGNEIYHGAPILAAMGAEKTGVDLLFCFVPPVHAVPMRIASPNFIVSPFVKNHFSKEDIPAILERVKESNALCIGNGFGNHPETKEGLLELLNILRTKDFLSLQVIIDAEGLIPEILQPLLTSPSQERNCILTPHIREYERLFGETPTPKNLKQNAQKYGCTILLKGGVDYIAGPNGEYAENTTGHAIMTVGGTGDTLSGIVTGFASQDMTGFEATKNAAYFWGKCGEEIAKTQSSATAKEIIQLFPKLLL